MSNIYAFGEPQEYCDHCGLNRMLKCGCEPWVARLVNDTLERLIPVKYNAIVTSVDPVRGTITFNTPSGPLHSRGPKPPPAVVPLVTLGVAIERAFATASTPDEITHCRAALLEYV